MYGPRGTSCVIVKQATLVLTISDNEQIDQSSQKGSSRDHRPTCECQRARMDWRGFSCILSFFKCSVV